MEYDKPDLLNAIAARMRIQAHQTIQPGYRGMMNRAARSLEDEADRLTEFRFGCPASSAFH